MIVLDEQLLRFDLEVRIRDWYPGTVCFVTALRPASVIKDDGIPALLRMQRQPTFVTINERDFWRKVNPDERYCIICFALPLPRAHEIPDRLRTLLHRPEFKTKAKRMGTMIHVTPGSVIRYYTTAFAQPAILAP
ncbi:MAG: hypothetical protein DYG89_30525 [Caldilinea sp. CFX5]|nr:hypothetical protein [Caldilinea sp. CFX5]